MSDTENSGNPDSSETPADGLSSAEAERRLEHYGPNEIAEKERSPLRDLLAHFWGPIPWMIEIAAALSAVVQHWADFVIISVLLVVNATVGFWEEYQAGNAIAALKRKLALRAKVRRDGRWGEVPARELVPGDRIHIRIGDIVPADAQLLEDDPLEVDQSALTGESLPVERKAGEGVYSGSIVRRGESDAQVTTTGSNTYFGKTARLVGAVQGGSHFQKAVLNIGNHLIVLAVALVALIIGVALHRGDPMFTTLQFALVLTIAAIPVAMPTVLSVTMAVGARLLAHREAIVSRLASIEELAGMDVLCSDKTGTLTQNKLEAGTPYCLGGIDAQQLILNAALASRAENRDTIDLAVFGALKDAKATSGYHIEHFQPFDPVSKRTEAVVVGPDGKRFKVSKGAPQVILELTSDADKGEIEKAVNEFASRGYRSLGVARADGEMWRFLGVLPLFDPPREDSKATIEAARQMGIGVKMVTGDQLAIGKEIAGKVGLGTNLIDARLFGDSEQHMDGKLDKIIERADGFAQVFPEHKYRIVEALQHAGHIVGMTGDGVNDAPALKKADAGIAVSGATDAARAAADIVLLQPGLSVIIEAIQESRRIFRRMTSYATYRIAETIRVLLFMTLSILIFNFYPVTAIMIVLLALLNDGAILSIAYDRAHFSMRPEAWNMREVLGLAGVLGVIGVVASFGLFYLGERVFHLDRGTIQTLMYLKLSVAGHLTIFITRTPRAFWREKPAPILLWAVVSTQVIATLISIYGLFMPAIGWKWAGAVWGYAFAWFFINDGVKLATLRILRAAGAVRPAVSSVTGRTIENQDR
ncbi:MAG TPA: plasma-membrane proton-efflux P-type ATPase [Burkholderiales bacterium]|nr:plasma-membrane proton-efflux P-type ATPase [Burkholderiales bacterium]